MNIISETQIQITSPIQTTNYIVGSDILANLHKLKVLKNNDYRTFLLLSDEIIFKLYADMVIQSLQKLGKPIITSVIKPGEDQKSFAIIPKIINPYFKHGFDKKACLISLGGGVITDLGGFIASILLRGIEAIYIPTTIIGQVDAAIGGKTGVDFWISNNVMYKNMLGAFYQPRMVISDIDTLFTLPKKEILNGLGELMKYWVGWGKPTLEQLFMIKKAIKTEELVKIVSLCQQIKTEIVEKDPFDTLHIREKLNLGHTIGHAIEGVTNGKLSHGEAVSIGLVAAAKISVLMKMLNVAKYKKIIEVIRELGLPTNIRGISKKQVMSALAFDKKGDTFVLIKDIGKMITEVKVSENIIHQALDEVTL